VPECVNLLSKNMPHPKLNVLLENLITECGGVGRFQIVMIVIANALKLPVAWSMNMMAFGAAVPDWWCSDDVIEQNSTNDGADIMTPNHTAYQSCTAVNTSQACSSYVWGDRDMRTVVSEVWCTVESIFFLAVSSDSVCMHVSIYIYMYLHVRKIIQNYTEFRLHFRGHGAIDYRDCSCSWA
jgi:hypothetical protein